MSRTTKSTPEQRRAEELVDFLQAVALGEHEATDQEVTEAQEELYKLLLDSGLH